MAIKINATVTGTFIDEPMTHTDYASWRVTDATGEVYTVFGQVNDPEPDVGIDGCWLEVVGVIRQRDGKVMDDHDALPMHELDRAIVEDFMTPPEEWMH